MSESKPPRRKLSVLSILVGVSLLCLGWFCYQLFGPNPSIIVSRETTFITQPLDADGLPDYGAYLLRQASEGVTPDNNAAVLIWQAMWPGELQQEYWLPLCDALGMAAVPSQLERLVAPYDTTVRQQITLELLARYPKPTLDDEAVYEQDYARGADRLSDENWQTRLRDETAGALIDEAMSRPWTTEQIPAIAKWIKSNQKPLDLLVEAAARPCYFSPSPNMLDDSDRLLITMLLPDLQMMRTALRALQVRSMWQLGEGRTARAWQDLLACHRLARLTAKNDTLVGQLVAIAIEGVACNGTNLFLHHGNLALLVTGAVMKWQVIC